MIPEDYTDFLHWVKEQTEAYWSKPPAKNEDELGCEEWAHGAKWIGLDEAEITNIEQEFNVKFTWHHKQFLKILHTIDRSEIIAYTESWEDDAEVLYQEIPFFYNWKKDKEEIRQHLTWPYETILEDVLGVNKVWLKSWGNIRPKSDEVKEKIFAEWFKKVPPLVPINRHQFVVSDTLDQDTPVLSIYGSDVIVHGWNMRHYLLSELGAISLGLSNHVYDEEDEQWYYEATKEYEEVNIKEFELAKNKDIPVLKEMILYWSSGWRSFGLKYPYPKDGPKPITKTFIPKDEDSEAKDEDTQKRFNPF